MKFVRACLGEMKKQRRNYFNSYSTYISLLVWPLLTVICTYYKYSNFSIKLLNRINIYTKEDLLVFLTTGYLCYNLFWVMVQSALFMKKERENGTLETIFLSPASRIAVVYGRSMGALFQSIWLLIIYCVMLIVIYKGTIIHILLELPLIYLCIIFSAIIFGGFINTIFIVSRDTDFWFSLCDEPMKLLTGVELPISIMPLLFRCIAYIFPLTYCLEIVRGLIGKGEVEGTMLFRYAMVNGIFLIMTKIIMTMAEKYNRKTGNLQLY